MSISRAERPALTMEQRRARRQARREKQRASNAGRAAKMHAARLLWETAANRSEPGKPDRGREIHVGCSGWFYWHWRGGFYPAESSASDWFDHYARRFRTVELNAPFYSWPTVNAVKAWIRQAGRRQFVYTVKVSELITHVKQFTGTRALVRDFGHIADLLGPRMGCFLFQLPPSYTFTPARLRRILLQLDPARRNVVEFRHRSWWNDSVFAAFREVGAIFCSCSAPRLPDELIKTADEIYIRFHGVKQWYRHDYTAPELAAWADRIKKSGASRVWAYFNNDRDCRAVENARALLKLLSPGAGR